MAIRKNRLSNLHPNFEVLASPAGFMLSDKTGSDPTIGYELLRLISEAFSVRFHAITSKVDIDKPLPKTVSVYEAHVSNNLLGHAIFILKYYVTGKSVIRREKINIIHHITFHYGANFNPLAMENKHIPFVIGPAYYDPPLPARLVKELTEERTHSFSDRMPGKALKYANSIITSLSIKTIKRADAIIAVNNATRNAYARLTDSKKIKVIPIGVRTEDFKPTAPPKNSDILIPAALIKARGVKYAIKAMPKILKEHREAKLHVVGDGPEKPFLQRLCKQLNIESSVVFHGRLPHKSMNGIFKSCRLVVLPSILQSFGNVLLEAMASGRPVVATEALGPREIVVDGETGYVVPIADSDALAEAISRLLSDYELCCKMGIKGRKLVEDKYSWHVVAEQYYRVYRSLA